LVKLRAVPALKLRGMAGQGETKSLGARFEAIIRQVRAEAKDEAR
jgi:hypothetical protein